VLVYHAVADVDPRDDPHRLATSPRHLRSHLRLLRRIGYGFTVAGDFSEREPGLACLTFDDGWRDALDAVVPALQEAGAPASFYVCPGWWGGEHPDLGGRAGTLLAEAEVAELARLGMEIGSHSVTHRDLRSLPDDELAAELRDSKHAIEAATGRTCRTFAYPYGLRDERVVAAVANAGYEVALTWGGGDWRPLEVPRLPAPPRGGGVTLGLKLAGIRGRA
jgi:peptidoglycan/xylan/chitin deacetylase (PgdA/CDA1 family)